MLIEVNLWENIQMLFFQHFFIKLLNILLNTYNYVTYMTYTHQDVFVIPKLSVY